MPFLDLPNKKYKDSYIAAVRSYRTEGIQAYRDRDPDWLQSHFDEFVEQLHTEARGENLADGYVPHTEFWLVEGNEFLGRLDIRHELNEFLRTIGGHIGYDIRYDQRGKGYGTLILQLGLEKAKELGLHDILITCDVGNIRSAKVIERNGGVFHSSEHGKKKYWIKI